MSTLTQLGKPTVEAQWIVIKSLEITTSNGISEEKLGPYFPKINISTISTVKGKNVITHKHICACTHTTNIKWSLTPE